VLLNNTAYALCLAGQPGDAKRLLDGSDEYAPAHIALTATRAPAELLLGDTERGLAGYRKARDLARDQKRPDLEALVRINMALAINRLPNAESTLDLPEIGDEWRVARLNDYLRRAR
jgi:hypothetical protein